MSTPEPQAANTAGQPPAPALDELRDADIREVAGFIHAEATGAPPSAEQHAAMTRRAEWLLRENPANTGDAPLGWVLRDGTRPEGSRIVGAMMCIPQRLVCRGATVTALMSAKWFVSAHCRGGGVGIFMRYAALAKKHPLFCTTAAPGSAALWKKFGGYEIAGHDHELIGADRWGPMVEEAALRKLKVAAAARAAGALALAVPGRLRAARRAAAGCGLDVLRTAAEAAAAAAAGPTESATALRDEAFIEWRHFRCPDPEPRELLAFTARGGGRALVVAQVVRRGGRGQVRALQVLDLFGAVSAGDMPAAAGALAGRYRGRFDVMAVRGQPADRQAALVNIGFVRRAFEAPIAWCIDKHGLLPSREWYLVPADAE